MKQFALIGTAGYIAPRHLKAIKDTNNNLAVAMDTADSVGIMDMHFPSAEFFTEFEDFAAFVEDEALKGNKLDYVSICTPNYLHAPQMKFALKNGIDVICEKPLVLTASEIDILKEYEKKYGAKVNSILQLRLHPSIIALQEKVAQSPKEKIFDVELTYMTSRGKWYLKSWKGFDHKSGGVATNVGVHFFDMLGFIFGGLKENVVHQRTDETAAGYLEFERARVRWFLSVSSEYLPDSVKGKQTTYRSIAMDGEEIEFSGGFTDLHTESYRAIIAGQGYGLADVRPSIEIVSRINHMDISQIKGEQHPFIQR